MKSIAVLAAVLCASTMLAQQAADSVRINQIQVVGSHNSYHTGLTPAVGALLKAKSPKSFDGLDYGHQQLAAQLDAGIRQIELDVFADPNGGKYAHPAYQRALAAMNMPADEPYNADGVMDKPGFKVMHVQDLDQRTSCATFVLCLQQVRTWSQAHPQHVPIFILVEAKAGKALDMPGAVTPDPYTPAVFDALDAEIRSVFRPGEYITPDQLRSTHSTLPEAIANGGWPTLAAAQGKVIFLLDNRALTPVYAEGHPALRGRVLFTNSVPGDADAAFTEQNDGSKTTIDELVKKGYLVRTRSDADTVQARTNDTTRREVALSSGAQMISTDYWKTEPAKWPGHFFVSLPGNAVVRCNPVNAPATCNLTGLTRP